MRRFAMRQIMIVGAVVCMLATLVVMPSTSRGDKNSSRLCALQMILNARKLGFKVRNGDFGYLTKGKTKTYKGLLYRGSTYMVVACGDDGVKDLDLYLYKVRGRNLVAVDSSKDNTPTLSYTPSKSGVYALQVKMHSGSGNYTIAVLYK